MTELKQKRTRLRLDPEAYVKLTKQVLARDGWRCQNCGASDQLQIHHLNWRSRLGVDCIENLITLCANCHARLHRNVRAPHMRS
jgi:5-methylcytosine-specific restriction endonuclease McrA